MRSVAPEGFSVSKFFEGVYTFQQWELFPGHSTTGPKNVSEHMTRLGIPERLDGLRVLDIAPWNGFFGFECIRRGATSLVSVGPDDPEMTGYEATRKLLEIDNCKYMRGGVYDLSPNLHGTFDIVLFLGLIYHLRHPLLALDRIWDVTNNKLYCDSPIIDNVIFDQTVPENERSAILEAGRIYNRLPLVYYTKGSETGDAYNWFMPNIKGFRDFVESSGFVIDTYVDDGGWASISATRGERTFVPGLEGWNERALRA